MIRGSRLLDWGKPRPRATATSWKFWCIQRAMFRWPRKRGNCGRLLVSRDQRNSSRTGWVGFDLGSGRELQRLSEIISAVELRLVIVEPDQRLDGAIRKSG